MRRLIFHFAGLMTFVAGVALVTSSGGPRAAESHSTSVEGGVAYTRVWKDDRGAQHWWITVANLAGGSRHVITPRQRSSASLDHGPAWSPDGSRLAFIREGRSGSGLYVANRDGTRLRKVLPLPNARPIGLLGHEDYEASGYAWSPDGRRLAVAYGPLYVVDWNGANRTRLLDASSCRPSWSPDGRSLLVLRDEGCSSHRGNNTPELGFRAIDRIGADGSRRRQLAIGSFGAAAWSPNGRTIAFLHHCRVQHSGDWFCSLSLMNADGSRKRRLAQSVYGDWLSWAAGGRQVLWPFEPSFNATSVIRRRTQAVLPRAYESGFPVGMSADGARIAVLAASRYDIRTSQVVPPLIVVTTNGRLIRSVSVPKGWKSGEAAVHLP